MVEVALMAPWIFFLFVGALDLGFFCYELITTQNAARVAAMANSFSSGAATNQTTTCQIVVAEMNSLPNTKSLVPGTYVCPASGPSSTSPIAVDVSASPETESDGSQAAVVTVSYFALPMIPIPGVLNLVDSGGAGWTIHRTAKVPILNSAPGG